MIDVLAIGAHPDDVEIFAGATLARWRRRGARLGLLHLTRGEAATRGTPEGRREEAAESARILGAEQLEILDLGDGRLHDSDANRAAIVRLIRAWKPRVLLGPWPSDDHPDHAAAGALTKAAWYLAGIARAAGGGERHRPAGPWFYFSHEEVEPSFVVAVEEEDVETKLRAIACYRAQMHDPDSAEPATRISEPSYAEELRARLRHHGARVGATWGEPFRLARPVAVHDPEGLLPGTGPT